MSKENGVAAESWRETTQKFWGGVFATVFLLPVDNRKRIAQISGLCPHPALSLRESYRGVATALLLTPTLAAQVGGASKKDPRTLSVAIAASALIIGPAETFIFNQQLY